MATDEKNVNPSQLTDKRTSGEGPAGTPTVLGRGKVQQGNVDNVSDEQSDKEAPEGAKDKVAVVVNSAEVNDKVGITYYDEDGNLKSEDFAPGRVHYVSSETAELKVAGRKLFVPAPEDSE